MLAVMILIFAAVFSMILACYLIIRARSSPVAGLRERLKRMEGEPDRDDVTQEFVRELLRDDTPVEEMIGRLPFQGVVGRLLEFSGTGLTPSMFTLFNVSAFAMGFLLLFLLRDRVLPALIGGIVSSLLPMAYLKYQGGKRRASFEEQLPDVLVMIARSLQAGHSLTGAVELTGQEMPEPSGGLFRLAYEKQKLGVRISDALTEMPERIDSMDLRFFVTVVKMNNEIGGSLAEVLEKLAETIRARLQIRRQVRVYTAEGKLSGYILASLPFAVFGIIYLTNPGYLEPFFTQECCKRILYGVLLAQMVGFMVIRKIINIRI